MFNRKSVQEAIKAIKGQLPKKLPPNGLMCFSGKSDKEIIIVMEPLKPINQYLYRCDNRFHTDIIRQQIASSGIITGFVIIDGKGVSFHTLTDQVKTNLFQKSVEMPSKHGMGGQSAQRFGRIREEKRDLYISNCVEWFRQIFMKEGLLMVTQLIFAGNSNLKHELASKLGLQEKIIAYYDIQYSGTIGFNHVLTLSANRLQNVSFLKEQKILTAFFDCIALSGNYAYGIEALRLIEIGAVDTLIVWDNIKTTKGMIDHDDNSQPVLDWLLENDLNIKIELVSDTNPLATQFIEGFGGIGALLRYKVNMNYED